MAVSGCSSFMCVAATGSVRMALVEKSLCGHIVVGTPQLLRVRVSVCECVRERTLEMGEGVLHSFAMLLLNLRQCVVFLRGRNVDPLSRDMDSSTANRLNTPS